MYEPEKLDDDTWAKYTKALTDCNSKTADYVADRSGGTPYSTSQVHGYIQNPAYTDIHHYVLQYLEEGTMDLVCLSTELEMEHCDTMRETAGLKKALVAIAGLMPTKQFMARALLWIWILLHVQIPLLPPNALVLQPLLVVEKNVLLVTRLVKCHKEVKCPKEVQHRLDVKEQWKA